MVIVHIYAHSFGVLPKSCMIVQGINQEPENVLSKRARLTSSSISNRLQLTTTPFRSFRVGGHDET